jgi:hypothetical protein
MSEELEMKLKLHKALSAEIRYCKNHLERKTLSRQLAKLDSEIAALKNKEKNK